MALIDLHAHFPMHLGFRASPGEQTLQGWRRIGFRAANLAFNSQAGRARVTLRLAHLGQVRGFGSVLYSPAGEFSRPPTPGSRAIDDLLFQIEQVEAELSRDPETALARGPSEFEQLVASGRMTVFHCLEGAHALGGDPENVRRLAGRGIASITLAHLLFRGVATCSNPFPHIPEALFRRMNPQPANIGLTTLGRELTSAMFEEGVMVDVTHCSPAALDDVFAIADRHPHRPVLASHVGVLGTSNSLVNLSDDVVRRIARSGGLIGVTMSPFRLRPSPLRVTGPRHAGLVFRAIDHIARVTGSYDAIAIGTDLDGFIRPIREFSNYGQAATFSNGVVARYGPEIASRILVSNALRVLNLGWRGR